MGLRIALLSTQPSTVVNPFVEMAVAHGHEVPLLVGTRLYEVFKEQVFRLPRGMDALVVRRHAPLAALLAAYRPDVVFALGWPWLLGPEVLAVPRLGCVNTHFSLLPALRGRNSLGWQLYAGTPTVGATLHRMDESFDTGGVLATVNVEVLPEDDCAAVKARLLAAARAATPAVLEMVERGEPGRPQPTEGGSWAPRFGEEHRPLDWRWPSATLHARIRALEGEAGPGATAPIDGVPHVILGSRLTDERADAPPGTVLRRDAEAWLIATGDGALLLTDIQEGTTRSFDD